MLHVAQALPSLGETLILCKKQLSQYVSMVLLFITPHVEGDSTFLDQSVNASPKFDQWKKYFVLINYLDLTGQSFKGGTVSGQMKGIARHFPAVPALQML